MHPESSAISPVVLSYPYPENPSHTFDVRVYPDLSDESVVCPGCKQQFKISDHAMVSLPLTSMDTQKLMCVTVSRAHLRTPPARTWDAMGSKKGAVKKNAEGYPEP